jgi:HSP20 family protein
MNTSLMRRPAPGSGLEGIDHGFDRLFEGLFGPSLWSISRQNGNDSGTQGWLVPADLIEREDHLLARFDVPGLGEDEISVELADGMLSVSGERKHESRDAGDGYERIERGYGRFLRRLSIPSEIDAEAIEAKLADGVLEIRMPKSERVKPRKIEIAAESGGE